MKNFTFIISFVFYIMHIEGSVDGLREQMSEKCVYGFHPFLHTAQRKKYPVDYCLALYAITYSIV